MATQYISKKYYEISLLAEETAKQVTRNREEWIRYLTTAARLYKYPFEDQILIYAQRPDAQFCATMKIWNERMFCWTIVVQRALHFSTGRRTCPHCRLVFSEVL